MSATLITNQAKEKIQPLVNSPTFKHSLNKFLKLTKAYTEAEASAAAYRNMLGFKKWRYKKILNNVHQIEDIYIFRDKDNRFIFTIEKDKNKSNTAILLDVVHSDDIAKLSKYVNSNIKEFR